MQVMLEKFGIDDGGPTKYLLDIDTGKVTEGSTEVPDGRIGCCGYGRFVTIGVWPQQVTFVGIHLLDRAILLRVGDRAFDITNIVQCSRRNLWLFPPICKVSFVLKGGLNQSYTYWSSEGGFPETDIFEYIIDLLRKPFKMKFFIYVWAAFRAGTARYLPEEGYTNEFLNSLTDPFEV